MGDLQRRTVSIDAAREIKASEHYTYITNGITLDGTKFAQDELVLEGQCLVKDNVSGKYEKYADAAVLAKPAVIIGGAAINNASLAGIHADTVLTLTINGKAFTVANAVLAALAADSTDAVITAALSQAVAADGAVANDYAEFTVVASKIHIATRDSGAGCTLALAGTWGAAPDEAAIEGVFGISIPASATGATASSFPAGKSNPVVLDESVRFKSISGTNPDMTAGQVIIHSAGIYRGMVIGLTPAFEAAVGSRILFV
jgi:hypothetical protein